MLPCAWGDACCQVAVACSTVLSISPCPLPSPPLPVCSHINGLALALLLGVDGAILPPAVCRATFNVTLDHLDDNELWSPQPLGTLLDMGKMQAHWRQRHGIELQEVRLAGDMCMQAGRGEGAGSVLTPERRACTFAALLRHRGCQGACIGADCVHRLQ